MTKRRLFIIGAVLAIPVIAIGWWLAAPLFFEKEVNEEFPMSASAEIPDDMTAEEVEAEMEKAAGQPDSETEDEMMDGEPAIISTGDFSDADEFHQGSGTATIYELEDGSHVLRLEDFEVTNGPDLHVLLVPAWRSNIERRHRGLHRSRIAKRKLGQPELRHPCRRRPVSVRQRHDLLQTVPRGLLHGLARRSVSLPCVLWRRSGCWREALPESLGQRHRGPELAHRRPRKRLRIGRRPPIRRRSG